MDFYKDSEDDTYWLSLKCDGKYHFEGYTAEYTIHEDNIMDVLRVFRGHIKEKPETEQRITEGRLNSLPFIIQKIGDIDYDR